MLEGKKGLRLLSLSIILQIAWAIAAVIIDNKVLNGTGSAGLENFWWNYVPMITAIIAVLCYFMDFGGLRIAGHESNYFARAWKLKILSLLAAFVAVIFGIIAATQEWNTGFSGVSGVITMVAYIFIAAAEVLILVLVTKGCAELAPRAEKLSKFVLGLFILQTILLVVSKILDYIVVKHLIDLPDGAAINEALLKASGYIGIVFVVLAAVFAVFYILLIFKATRTAGKAKR